MSLTREPVKSELDSRGEKRAKIIEAFETSVREYLEQVNDPFLGVDSDGISPDRKEEMLKKLKAINQARSWLKGEIGMEVNVVIEGLSFAMNNLSKIQQTTDPDSAANRDATSNLALIIPKYEEATRQLDRVPEEDPFFNS